MKGVMLNDRIEEFNLEAALSELPPDRRAYALHYHRDEDRRLSAAVYLLLRDALRITYGIEGDLLIERDAYGKPYLRDYPSVHFNLSHCDCAAACVVDVVPVGIDVEVIAPLDWGTVRAVLSDAEIIRVREAEEPEVEFAVLWTRKEALVKMRGTGINEKELPGLLVGVDDAVLETELRRDKGYVVSVARAYGHFGSKFAKMTYERRAVRLRKG